jgi:hypothetical protein
MTSLSGWRPRHHSPQPRHRIATIVGHDHVAAILYGLFDNGIIKGYVFSPANPQPLVHDLEHWTPDIADATTAYRLIGDNCYLFVVRH